MVASTAAVGHRAEQVFVEIKTHTEGGNRNAVLVHQACTPPQLQAVCHTDIGQAIGKQDDPVDVASLAVFPHLPVTLLETAGQIRPPTWIETVDGPVEALLVSDFSGGNRDTNAVVIGDDAQDVVRAETIHEHVSCLDQVTDLSRVSHGPAFVKYEGKVERRTVLHADLIWRDDPDLGVEINRSLYWRSEDGPELIDGFHAMVQWGILFPMQGLGYTSDDEASAENFDDLEIPNALRVMLGIVF